jgi:hypothetical protein
VSFRFITKSIHAYWIDYPVAVLLMIAPFVLRLGQTNSVAFWLSIIVGVAALLLVAFTDLRCHSNYPLLAALVGGSRSRRGIGNCPVRLNSAGSRATNLVRASIPPAETPRTTIAELRSLDRLDTVRAMKSSDGGRKR